MSWTDHMNEEPIKLSLEQWHNLIQVIYALLFVHVPSGYNKFPKPKANPSCCLVSGPGQIQMRMQAGGFSHYVIISL